MDANICPFCGGHAEIAFGARNFSKLEFYAMCASCHAQGPHMNTAEEAVAAWLMPQVTLFGENRVLSCDPKK